ncbi:MAG: colanic acid biosynthesis glycosyltransferase WcaE [Desulfuromonadia bacterium]
MSRPVLTVITVVLNNARPLRETIESVKRLRQIRCVHLIIDGGSRDSTIEVIRDHAVRDPRIRWISEPDRGIYDAMNKGWLMADPESRILFLGAGDRLLSLPDQESLAGDGVIFGDVLIGRRLFKGGAGWALRISNTLHHQALLVPRAIHPEPPFDLRFRLYADFDFNQRLLKRGVRFRYDPALRAAALPGGVSSRKDRREMLAVVGKNFGPLWSLVALLCLPFRMLGRIADGVGG